MCPVSERRNLSELVSSDPAVAGVLTPDQIAYCFDESRLLAHVQSLIDRLQQLEDPANVAR